jgi:hypothetical protein
MHKASVAKRVAPLEQQQHVALLLYDGLPDLSLPTASPWIANHSFLSVTIRDGVVACGSDQT